MADVIKFENGKSDEARESDGYDVACPRCGGAVFMNDNRCPHCQLWFQGKASQFSKENYRSADPKRYRMFRWVMIILALLMLLPIIAAFFG